MAEMATFPVRVRGEVVGAVGHPVPLPDDFPALVEKRLREVMAVATEGFLSVYITVDFPEAPRPTRPEEV